MVTAYIFGLAFGIIAALSTGPVFLTLVQTSIEHGFKNTLYFIIGVALTDTSIILITWYGLNELSSGPGNSSGAWLPLVGGVLLVVFGVAFILQKPNEEKEEVIKPLGSKFLQLGLFTKAIMLNAINPIVWGFWAAMSNQAITEFHDSSLELSYFAGILSMIWMTDLLKGYYAQKLKTILNERVKKNIRLAIGAVLMIMGLKLIVEVFLTS